MRIGILTYHHVQNYGAFLQTYAHVIAISELFPDATVEVIDYRHPTIERYEFYNIINRALKFEQGFISELKGYFKLRSFFRSQLPLAKQKCQSTRIEEIVKYINRLAYDYIIVGSDEVWKVQHGKGRREFPTIYWLPPEITARRIASAASANGSNLELLNNTSLSTYLKNIVRNFQVIATRDQFSYDLISTLGTNAKLYQVPDPTFGIDFNLPERLKKHRAFASINFDFPVVAVNMSAKSPESQAFLREVKAWANQTHAQLVAIAQPNEYCDKSISKALNPIEWGAAHSLFDFVITDRFHSTVFAIKGNTPFWSVDLSHKYPVKQANRGKIVDMLQKLDLLSHHTFLPTVINVREQIVELIKTGSANEVLKIANAKFRREFREHLVGAFSVQ